jgi:hypothetical protein
VSGYWDRDAKGNWPPHAWAAAFAILVLGGMLIRYVVAPVIGWIA